MAQRKVAKRRKPTIESAKYPKLTLEKALRIPRAILDQNAGKDTSDKDAANFVGVGFNGPFRAEVGSSIKFGLLERPSTGKLKVADIAKQILRPKSPTDEIEGYRKAALTPAEFSEVYDHYRGENLPDAKFLDNALTDTFKIPASRVSEFKDVFLETLKTAKLLEEHNGKLRLTDVSTGTSPEQGDKSERIKRLEKDVKVSANDTCFVMMPFAHPIGGYYSKIYEPAVTKAGLRPIRADNEIFGTGKIIDQIWSGINSAKVLVAELTKRNANVFYELGLAHALGKPVVLVSSNEQDVPFDLQHIRVIYYDVNDPFWGTKLIEKIAENILSAIKNPADAIFQRALSQSSEQ